MKEPKALLDTGSGVTGLSTDWYTRSGITHQPSALKPFVCRSVTDHTVNTTQHLANCSISIGNYHTIENFALLPISKTYQAILGKDFIRAIGLKIDFGSDPENVLIIQKPPRSKTDTDIATCILPSWDEDVDLIGQVFELGAITADAPKMGHDFQILSEKKFKKMRKKAAREEAKITAKNRKIRIQQSHANTTASSPSILKISCLAICLLATAGLGEASLAPSMAAKPSDLASIGANISYDPEKVFAQDKMGTERVDIGAVDDSKWYDPFITCPKSVLDQINKLRDDCVDAFATFKSRVYGCFSGMPHSSKINRKHEIPMSIELKDEFKDKQPPVGRTYRTPHNLLAVLKKSLIEMLRAGWIRCSTSDYCAPVIILVKPHQDLKVTKPEDIKYRVCVDASDLVDKHGS